MTSSDSGEASRGAAARASGWRAEHPARNAGQNDERVGLAEHEVCGSTISVAWDYGVRFPLWDSQALLPEDPAWLRHVLGLSEVLVRDLAQWCCDVEGSAAYADPTSGAPPTGAELDARALLDVRGLELSQLVRRELEPRYDVDYHHLA